MKTKLASLALIATALLVPIAAYGLPQSRQEAEHRRQTKNEWRELATIASIVALIGLLKKDGTITFVGTAGALYSAYRYEEDRKSEDKLRQARAEVFRRGSFTRNGVKYRKRTVWKGGKKYYQFAKVKQADNRGRGHGLG